MGNWKMGLLTTVLLLCVSSAFSSSILPPSDPPAVLYNCVMENWGSGKDTAEPCILCFTASQGRFVERVLACSELFLPTAHQLCSGEFAAVVDEDQEAVEDVLDCFEDTLDNMTAERCLAIVPDGSDTVDTLVEAALCLTEAKTNATHFIENFLGVEPGQQRIGERYPGDGERYPGDGERYHGDGERYHG